MESGSRFVEHSAVSNAAVAIYGNARSAALGSTAGVGHAGKAIRNAVYSKRSWGLRTHPKRRTVADPMRKSKSKIIQRRGIERVCPPQSARVLLSSSNLPACGSDDNVITGTGAVIRVKHAEKVIA